MRRFSLTPTPRKSIHSVSNNTPRQSIGFEEVKRNIRNKDYKQNCAEVINDFLISKNYDGNFSISILLNPSNKDFQNILKFIFSFIDTNPIVKIEDEIIYLLKILKYPFCNEITRSQLISITPHAWPVILSMMYWVVELIKNSENFTFNEKSIESEFFKYICLEYEKFMNNEEIDSNLSGEEEFLEKIKCLHYKENEEIELIKEEIELMENELKTINGKFEDTEKLAQKIKKQNEDLNMLLLHENQTESKKEKYVKIIEDLQKEIVKMEEKTAILLKEKEELNLAISNQNINFEDIEDLKTQQRDLMLELDRLKPLRDQLLQNIKEYDNELLLAQDYHENLSSQISNLRNGENVEISFDLSEYENELNSLKENLVNFEINNKNLEEEIDEKSEIIGGFEQQLSHLSNKLKTMGSIYAEKKDIFDRQQQQSLNELDKLENDLLRLKLESVSGLQRNEKELSEKGIQLDLLESQIKRENEEINKVLWEFTSTMQSQYNKTDEIEQEIKRLLNE